MRCQQCGKETFLPFTCPYCGGSFCTEHRLPESHNCTKIELARMPKEEAPSVYVQTPRSYEYTVSYRVPNLRRGRVHFSVKEVQHLAVAALLVVGVGLSSVLLSRTFAYDVTLVLFAVLFAVSFFAHEFAHKIVAQRSGFWAEFRLTLIGALVTLVSVFSPFKLIAPGAVMVSGSADRRTIGRISIAGPLTNICLSFLFLQFALLFPDVAGLLFLVAAFNAWIAFFNLIPYGVFDGLKIFSWDKRIWACAFFVSLGLTVFLYWFIFLG